MSHCREVFIGGVLILSLALFACGGGGGGGGAGSSDGPVTITSQNAPQVSLEAVNAAIQSGSTAQTTGVQTTVGAVPSQALARLNASLGHQILALLDGPQLIVGAVTSTSCQLGGTISTNASSDGTSASVTF